MTRPDSGFLFTDPSAREVLRQMRERHPELLQPEEWVAFVDAMAFAHSRPDARGDFKRAQTLRLAAEASEALARTRDVLRQARAAGDEIVADEPANDEPTTGARILQFPTPTRP